MSRIPSSNFSEEHVLLHGFFAPREACVKRLLARIGDEPSMHVQALALRSLEELHCGVPERDFRGLAHVGYVLLVELQVETCEA